MKKLTVKELNERIEELENRIFSIDMIDHWTSELRETWVKLNEELSQLKLKLSMN